MPFPQRIEVIRQGPICRVLVDGEQMPFPLPREALSVTVHPDEMPTIHLTLRAYRIDVANDSGHSKETTP